MEIKDKITFEEYTKELVQLRNQRAIARQKIECLTNEVENVLNILAVDYGDTLVSWDDFKKMQIGFPMYVSEKVYFIKYLDEERRMGFKCFLEAGGTFGIQSHDCLEEALVLKGNLLEATRKDKVYTVGQTITYLDDQLHKPYCTVDSIYKVIFTKSKDYEDNSSK